MRMTLTAENNYGKSPHYFKCGSVKFDQAL